MSPYKDSPFNLFMNSGDTTTLCDDKLNILLSHVSNGRAERPEIDRAQLRAILQSSIPPETIQWGKKLQTFSPPTLLFTDGSTHTADLIVGADGCWSHIRSALTPEVPSWTGASYCSLNLAQPSPALQQLVNSGSVFAINNGVCFGIQALSNGSMQIYTFFQPDSESWIESHGKDKSEFEPWLKDWNPMFRLAFATAELRFARNMYMLPVGFSWEHRRGITLIGDAAHVFTPFAGEGVNTGMTDAMALAETIINNRDIRDYEFSKFLLTKDVALLTWQNTLDTLSQTDIREHVEGLGRRLFRGVPDRQEDFGVESEGRVLNEALQRLGGRNVV